MKLKRLTFLITALTLLILSCSCSKKPDAEVSSLSTTHETVSQISGNDADNSSSSNKETSSAKTNTSSRIATVSRKEPQRTPSTTSYNITELPEAGKKVSLALIELLETTEPREVRFYSVKNTNYASKSYVPLKTVSKGIKYYQNIVGSDAIFYFKDKLEINTWESKKYTSQTLPQLSIYFDDTLHVNLELQNDKVSWVSIASPLGKAYYIVPEKVYNNIWEYYYTIDKE
ncbi:MAG: hypothetical protein UHH95_03340 [Oscillospiraceae bacterium]|nr:hypothetical protein [Oscillospiraceae bacterium]